jgi:hypothetical protein
VGNDQTKIDWTMEFDAGEMEIDGGDAQELPRTHTCA